MRTRVSLATLISLLAVAVAATVQAATPVQTTTANRQVALRASTHLLSDIVLPAAAIRMSAEPAGDGHQLARPWQRLFFAAQVDRHAFWTSAAFTAAVFASIKGHLPAGAKLQGSGSGGSNAFVSYTLPPTDRSALHARQLVVETVPLASGGIAVRADAEVQYLAPRPADQQVPRSAHVLEITMTTSHKVLLSLTITRRSQVRRIAALVDHLPFAGNWSGVAFSCPGLMASSPLDTFVFRAAVGGRVLARVSALALTPLTPDPCALTELTIGHHHQPPLMQGGVLLRRAGSLLGVKLTASP